MSIPIPPQSAKLVIGIFLKEKTLLEPIVKELSDMYGAIDSVSAWLPFDYTSYYEGEMGTPLFRRVFSFKYLIDQEALATIKLSTNALEKRYSKANRRRVNIDPGFLLGERFVLATGKNFTHRIYIGQGIYADLTLIYQKGRFTILPWTYPDYAASNMQDYLGRVRRKYLAELNTPHFLKAH